MKKFILIIFLVTAYASSGLPASQLPPPDATDQIEQISTEIKSLEKTISSIRLKIVEDKHLSSHEMKTFQSQIQKILAMAQVISSNANEEVSEYQDILAELEPEDVLPQDPQDKAYREHIRHSLNTYELLQKRSDSIIKRGQKLLGILSQREIKLKGRELLSVHYPLLSSKPFKELPEESLKTTLFIQDQSSKILKKLGNAIATPSCIIQLIGYITLSLIILIPMRRVTQYLDQRFFDRSESLSGEATSLTIKTLYFGLYPSIVFFLIPTFLKTSAITSPEQTPFFYISAFILSGIWISTVIANRLFLTDAKEVLLPAWMIPVSKEISARLFPFIVVLGINGYFILLTQTYDISFALAQTIRFSLRTVFGVNLLLLLKEKYWATPRENLRQLFHVYRFFSLLIALSNPFCILLGYTYLSDYLFIGYFKTTLLLGGILLVYSTGYHWIQALFINTDKGMNFFHISPRMAGLIGYWSNAFLILTLWISSIFSLLFIWEVGHSILLTWASKFMFGIDIAGHHFSFLNILIAIGTFLFLFTLTRYFQYILEKKVFPFTNLDVGLTHAIKISVGYIGLAFSILTAIHMLGFDLSSLLYVFGGLSVGAGLGLQPIVINFISGLMMLVERPVKIGDYVQVDGETGIVSNIRVRATEIQTFDHGCILIPNSRMITNTIKNLTHEDRTVSIEIPVIIKYGQDIEKVQNLLLACAKQHELVFADPAATVSLKSFSESSIELVLRCYLKDIKQKSKVSSDLRFDIEESLKKEHIAPYP